ncbi:YeeE/YedE family protein [Hoeflea sp. TYP-13]|uniref:YeeE/YedE family protein n=1 Tax=Hoeflea sp. TYP-13 TaxID=3230023 RepID=UPI0034C5D4FA
MGYVARRNHFCTMSSLERHWYAGDSTGIRSWVLAAAVALIVTQAMIRMSWLDVTESVYLSEPLPIAGSIIGGLMFGFGMALVGTCGFGALIRLGGGSLRAFVVLGAMAVSALAASRGIIGHIREAAFDPLSIDLASAGGQSIGALATALTGVDLNLAIAIVIGAALLFWSLKDASFREDHGKVFAGLVIGLCIAAGWFITASFSETLFEPVQMEAGSFVAPLSDTMMQIVTVTRELPDYGVGLVVGVLAGAAFAAWRADDVRWEACDDARELGRHLLGAFLMGTGGIFALGCTIGQGVSAVSVMAISAPIVMVSIVIGARIGLGVIVEGSAFGFLFGHRSSPAE